MSVNIKDLPFLDNHYLRRNARDEAVRRALDRDLTQRLEFTAVTTNTTLDSTYGTVPVDASGGAVTITLPAVSTNIQGLTFSIIKSDTSANAVTIDGNGSELISGELTQTLLYQGECLTLRCSGTAWWAI